MENNEYNGKIKLMMLYDETITEYNNNVDGGGLVGGGGVARRSGNVGAIDGGGRGRINVIQPPYDQTTNKDINDSEDKECEDCNESPCVCDDTVSESEVCETCEKEPCECEK
jgi:hypothetical protein